MGKLYFRIGADFDKVIKLREEIAKLKNELKNMDSTQSPDTFKKLNTQLGESTKKMNILISDAAKAGATMENDFKKGIYDGEKAVNSLSEEIIKQKNIIRETQNDVSMLTEQYKKLGKYDPKRQSLSDELNRAKAALGEQEYALGELQSQQANARLSVKKLRDEYSLYKNDGKQVVETNQKIGISLGKALSVIGGATALKALGSEIIRVRGEFQSMQTAIETLVGKDIAGKLIPQIKEMAKVSPLTLTDFVSAEKMMLGFNIESEKTIRYLQALSDISMGDSQKFNSLTLAFSQMSATGRLLGGDLNQMINAGFNPLQSISEKTGKSISTLKEEMSKGAISAEMVQQAFIDATSAGGKFYQMSENASKTINGQISMMKDAMDAAFNEMGQKSEGVIMKGIQMTTSLIENYETIGKILVGLVATYGTYRTAVMLVTAAESKHTLVEIGLTNARILARKAQLALNAAMLTNPYVLVATLIVGAATAMWAFHDSATAAEKAQRKFNDEQERFTSKEEERKRKIEDLIRIIQDETETEYTKIKVYEELQRYSPALVAAYNREQLAVLSLAGSQKVLNAERDKINYDEIISQVNKYTEYVKRLSKNGDKLANVGDLFSAITGEYGLNTSWKERLNLAEEDLKKWQNALDKYNRLKKQAEEDAKPVEVKLLEAQSSRDQIIQEYNAAKIVLEQEQEKLKNSPFAVIPIDVQIRFDNAQSALKGIDSTIDNLQSEKDKSSKTYQQAYKEAQADWKAKTKALEDAKKGSKDEYEKAKKELEESEKAYKNLGGITGSKLTKQESQAEKLRKQTDKYKLLLDKQALEQKRSVEDLQMKVDEARIKAMDEGSAKTIAEMELNFEKEMQAIDRQKEDALRKKIENARSVWEADPKNKGKSFDVTGIKLSDDEQKYFDELYKAAIADNEKTYSNLAYKYQSYTDERLAIEKKFNDDIAVLQEARKKAVEKGDTNEVAKIDRSIAKATVDKGKELMSHDFDVLKKSPEYVRAFEDLKNTSSETLSSLLEQLENAKQTAAETLNPEDLREYTTTIQEIMDELDSRNPFQALADRQKELAEAEKELAEAKKQLDAVNRGAKIVTGVKSISLGADGKIKIENTYLTATEALAKYNAAKDKSQKANNNFIKAEKTAREKVDELADAIKGIGDAIGGQAGEIISLMGDVALFATGTIDGISKVAQTGANAISAVEKASVILGIISTAIQLLQKISELGNNKAFKQYEEYAEKVKEINALTDAVNEYRVAALEAQQAEANWFSKDNLRNLRDYKALHDEVAKAYADKAMESQAVYQNQSGGGWLTGAFNWVMGNLSALSWWDKWKNIWGQGDYDKGQTAAINNLRIETRKKSKGFLGTGIGGKSQKTEDLVTWAKKQGLGDLFDDEGLLNKELAQSLIDNYGNKLVGQTKETLESLIKLREQYDEYIEQLHEYVSSLYEPLVDNFVDSLWDWFDNGKDALDSFKDYASDTFRNIVSDMMRTIVLEKVVGTFSDDIAALYEEYAKGAINEAELMKKVAERTNGLVDNYEQNIPTLQNIMEQVNGYLQNAGIDLKQSESSSQSSTSRGFQAMSQDTGEELNGRFTALQIIGEEIKNQAIEQTGLLSSINEKMSLLDLTSENYPLLTMPNVPDIAGQTREILASGYQSQITINFPTDKIESLASDVSSLKGIVDELRTNQIEKFNDVVEGVSKMAKNTPVMNKKIDSINDNIKKAL